MTALIVADPGLQTRSGHHAGFASLLASLVARKALPDKVDLYCHRALDDGLARELNEAGLGLHRHFATAFYAAFEPRENQAELSPYITRLAQEYRALVRDQAGKPGIVLHHTLDWPHLKALGLALKSLTGEAAQLRHVIFLIFNPGIDASGRVSDPVRALHYRMALSWFKGLENVRLFASCAEYSSAYAQLCEAGAPIGVHPCFLVDGSHERQHDAGAGRVDLRQANITLYLGDTKENKGFGRVGELIDTLAPHVGAQARLAVYCNIDRYLTTPAVQVALGALRAKAKGDPRIRLREGYLPHAELIDVVRATDLFVLNYDSRVYRDKTSGLVWLLSYYRKPMVLIGASWLSREASRLNPWTRCVSSTAELAAAAHEGTLVFPKQAIDEQYRSVIFEPFPTFIRRA
jgi:hypothetical protein